jgi:hypothetical protein
MSTKRTRATLDEDELAALPSDESEEEDEFVHHTSTSLTVPVDRSR